MIEETDTQTSERSFWGLGGEQGNKIFTLNLSWWESDERAAINRDRSITQLHGKDAVFSN